MNLPDNVRAFMEYIESRGYKCYLVGGAVRDILSGKTPKDFDFTTDAKPEEIKEIFEKYIETGVDFGTITAEFNGEYFEITTFRLEHRYSDGRRPDMVFYSDSLLSDLSRRDFTMNAIALDKDLSVYDYYNGMEDLKNHLLRTIGRAKVRFREDRLRKLRGIRIACENNYLIHEDILKSIKTDPGLEGVSGERIKTELDRILLCDSARRGVELLYRLHLIGEILPELDENMDPDLESWEAYTGSIHVAFQDLSLKVYLFLRPLKEARSIQKALDQLKYQRRIQKNAMAMAWYETVETMEGFMDHLPAFQEEQFRLFQQLDQVLGRFPVWERLLEEVIQGRVPRKVTDLAIGGADLKELGYRGREIGEILNGLLRKVVLEPENNRRDWLLAQIIKKKEENP
ncbi:CCA tRNA nucleotidyltransferase [Alkalibacter rhizosphaerae]|uniref:CCA tRNA nucleotidyltransferase n=1 Tax=Alkalibacter rhizosphaerae TaxID=2815577 RepID=A0A975AGQ2_9FIRM|nr:CCA tRNA nucleotidyltransferase [Alkalibacter rhizosphaerae]QSX07612.1 CCA tRNA nucleotidyltransferase [Alkalibacter rhizosphaerae]